MATPHNNDMQIELLTRARKLVDSGSTTFICTALRQSAADAEEVMQAVYLRTWVSRMLGERSITYADWAAINGYRFTADQRTKARLAWIDWMISHIKEQK